MMATGGASSTLSRTLSVALRAAGFFLFRISRRLLCASLAVVDLAPERRLAVHGRTAAQRDHAHRPQSPPPNPPARAPLKSAANTSAPVRPPPALPEGAGLF